ncbi:enoyl-CoA hydratase/isomerase family protein [Flavobacterium sp. NG2]|uniref:enoyl-CoA hydratase/isomerase family protein n=1 Tax=Flavobacterium sp. NG2 TaxID=3097547 RepID=UPI002A836CA1|nr:enoyl-CoA hydratase/isomerase family protein [Flavobacterium sp. NG2]WPR72428.1 enoyl-CoA hydratase/isomerase family protein [Flavobacterium sp. NG2]
MAVQETIGIVTTSIQNKTATLTFGHPASNSFPRNLLDQLTEQINTLSTNQEVSVIVLQSQGNGAFCAGASFDELLAVQTPEQGTHFFSGFALLLNAMRNCCKIIVGRVQGKAVGGGVGIIAACDYVFATETSAIKLSEIAIGIGPFVIEPAVSHKIGKTAMSQLALAPHTWKTAAWANEKGLFSEIFDNQEIVDKNLNSFVEKLASYHPEALYEMKKVLWEGTENWDTLLFERAEISGKLVLSDFTKNALSQFKK